VALQLLGEAFASVKKDGDAGPGLPGSRPNEDSDYVKVDTKSSRARDSQQGQYQY
jgi:hypothetical protein